MAPAYCCVLFHRDIAGMKRGASIFPPINHSSLAVTSTGYLRRLNQFLQYSRITLLIRLTTLLFQPAADDRITSEPH